MQPEVVTRSAAKASGLRHYFTGKPCGNGHVAPRFAGNGWCVSCAMARNKSPEKAAYDRARADASRTAIQSQQRAYYAANRPAVLASVKVWQAANKESVSHYKRMNKAARRSRQPAWRSELDEFAMLEAADLCRKRELATGFTWHVDHMVPLMAREACGLDIAANFQVIPAALNQKKSNKMILTEPREWLKFA